MQFSFRSCNEWYCDIDKDHIQGSSISRTEEDNSLEEIVVPEKQLVATVKEFKPKKNEVADSFSSPTISRLETIRNKITTLIDDTGFTYDEIKRNKQNRRNANKASKNLWHFLFPGQLDEYDSNDINSALLPLDCAMVKKNKEEQAHYQEAADILQRSLAGPQIPTSPFSHGSQHQHMSMNKDYKYGWWNGKPVTFVLFRDTRDTKSKRSGS